jgi:hypothetical protein
LGKEVGKRRQRKQKGYMEEGGYDVKLDKRKREVIWTANGCRKV